MAGIIERAQGQAEELLSDARAQADALRAEHTSIRGDLESLHSRLAAVLSGAPADA